MLKSYSIYIKINIKITPTTCVGGIANPICDFAIRNHKSQNLRLCDFAIPPTQVFSVTARRHQPWPCLSEVLQEKWWHFCHSRYARHRTTNNFSFSLGDKGVCHQAWQFFLLFARWQIVWFGDRFIVFCMSCNGYDINFIIFH